MLSRGGNVEKGQVLHYSMFRAKDTNDVISLLVDHGASLNAAMHQDEFTLRRFWSMSLGTPLHIAVELGKADTIRHLLKLGADTNVKDANGLTVMELAQRWNNPEAVRILESV